MLTGDFNADGNLDILVGGNSYSTEPSTGRYDAMTGLLLSGDGKGTFKPVQSASTGFKADSDVKSFAEIGSLNGTHLIIVGNNSGTMQTYQYRPQEGSAIAVNNTDAYAIVQKSNGQKYRQEFYYGSNYLSQTSRRLLVGKDAVRVTIYNNQGNKKQLILKQP